MERTIAIGGYCGNYGFFGNEQMPENVVWFFRGAKTQKGHLPRRCGET
jgi:hypothetical protein